MARREAWIPCRSKRDQRSNGAAQDAEHEDRYADFVHFKEPLYLAAEQTLVPWLAVQTLYSVPAYTACQPGP